MRNEPLISVIMPVYNVEQYLEYSVNSILNQTYSNFELILVDDCSPDSSGKICDNCADRDSRVKVIHKEKNEGLGKARNTGMSFANGDWIIFLDSDDWIEANTLESVHSCIDDMVDIIVWGYVQDFEDNEGRKKDTVKQAPISKEYIGLKEIGKAVMDLEVKTCFNYAWNKLYRKSLLERTEILFDDTILMEDFVFNIKIFPYAKKILTLDRIFNHYRKTPRETLVSKYSKEFFKLCKMKVNSELKLLKRTDNYTKEYVEMVVAVHLKHIMNACMKECSKASQNSLKGQYVNVKDILSDKHTCAVLSKVKVKNFKLQIIQKVLTSDYFLASFIMLKMMNFMMLNFSGIWRKLKRAS